MNKLKAPEEFSNITTTSLPQINPIQTQYNSTGNAGATSLLPPGHFVSGNTNANNKKLPMQPVLSHTAPIPHTHAQHTGVGIGHNYSLPIYPRHPQIIPNGELGWDYEDNNQYATMGVQQPWVYFDPQTQQLMCLVSSAQQPTALKRLDDFLALNNQSQIRPNNVAPQATSTPIRGVINRGGLDRSQPGTAGQNLPAAPNVQPALRVAAGAPGDPNDPNDPRDGRGPQNPVNRPGGQGEPPPRQPGQAIGQQQGQGQIPNQGPPQRPPGGGQDPGQGHQGPGRG